MRISAIRAVSVTRRQTPVITGAAAGGGAKSVSVTSGERLLGSRATSHFPMPKAPPWSATHSGSGSTGSRSEEERTWPDLVS